MRTASASIGEIWPAPLEFGIVRVVDGESRLSDHELLSLKLDELGFLQSNLLTCTSAQRIYGASIWLAKLQQRCGDAMEVRQLPKVEAALVNVDVLSKTFDVPVNLLASEQQAEVG